MPENEGRIIKTDKGPVPSKDGLGCEYFRYMKKFKDNVAQYIVDTGEVDTYGNLLLRCIRTAIKLQSKNLPKDAFVSICSKNHKDSVVPFIASAFIKLKFVGVDPSLSVDDMAFLFEKVTPSIIFVAPESVKLVEESIRKANKNIKIVVFGESDKYETFDEYQVPSDKEKTFQPAIVDYKETVIVFFSSGTTGLPKGICLNSLGILGQALNCVNYGTVRGASLTYTTLYWISSAMFLSAAIIAGAPRVIVSKFDPYQTWQLIDKYKISAIFLSPFQLNELLRVGKPEGVSADSLQNLLPSGGPTTTATILKARSILPHTFVRPCYGQTEMSGGILGYNSFNSDDIRLLTQKPDSCGKPYSGIHYKVVDPETEKLLGPMEQGELRLLSDYVMNGYHNQDASDAFDSDGWLRTGDIAYYDKDYCFYIVDRIKEMLKFQGFHVPPATVETVMYQHPAIQRAVVIGKPDEVDGDHLMGLVVLKPEYKSKVTPEEILEFVNTRVSDRQKLRAGVKFIQEVPLTPTGKVKRKILRDKVLKGEI